MNIEMEWKIKLAFGKGIKHFLDFFYSVIIVGVGIGIELVREELSRRGSDWQYIFEMEHLPLLPTKPSLIEGRYPTVGHFEGKMFSSWACEPGCYSTKPVLK